MKIEKVPPQELVINKAVFKLIMTQEIDRIIDEMPEDQQQMMNVRLNEMYFNLFDRLNGYFRVVE